MCIRDSHPTTFEFMSEHYERHNKNSYEGNGWSKYQLMVLQQLDDHNKVLQNLNKEIVDFKQVNAVSETETKLWKAQIMSSIDDTEEKLDNILYDERGLSNRLQTLERNYQVAENTSAKIKATWAFYGAIIMFIIDIAIKVFTTFLK